MSNRRILVVILTIMLFLSAERLPAAAAWFGRKQGDSGAIFKRDAAKAWESGKVVGKEKLDQAKETSKVKCDQAKKTFDKVSVDAKKKGQQVAQEGKGLAKDVQKRFGRILKD